MWLQEWRVTKKKPGSQLMFPTMTVNNQRGHKSLVQEWNMFHSLAWEWIRIWWNWLFEKPNERASVILILSQWEAGMLAYVMPFLISFSLQSAFEVLLLWFICLLSPPCLFPACLKVHTNQSPGSSSRFCRPQIVLMLRPNPLSKHIGTIANECEVVLQPRRSFFFLIYATLKEK